MADFDDELLALTETKRKPKGSSKKSKRQRVNHDLSSASDMDINSSDEDASTSKRSKNSEPDPNNPFPLEGKYKDKKDRSEILAMSELDREAILGERLEAQSAVQERQELRRMVEQKEKKEKMAEDAPNYSDDDGGIRTGRDRVATGATKDKERALNKLKKVREKKQAQRERGSDSPKVKRRKDDYESSEGDYEESASEEEQDTRRSPRKSVEKKGKKSAPSVDYAGPSDLKAICVTRAQLAALCPAPWFASWVENAWVRLSIGQDEITHEPMYRVCKVIKAERHSSKPYRIDNVKTDYYLTLEHGKAVKDWAMDLISNSPYTDREFARISQVLAADDMELPTRKDVEKIQKGLTERSSYTMTEDDLSKHLKEREASSGKAVNRAQGKARLITQRDYARSTGDTALFAESERALLEFGVGVINLPSPTKGGGTEQERMKKVNEKNRAMNREEIRRAEGRNQDERRRLADKLARGVEVKVDASARVKTMTRLKYDRDEGSRPTTPLPITPRSSRAEPIASSSAPPKMSKFDELVKDRIKIDIDLDF